MSRILSVLKRCWLFLAVLIIVLAIVSSCFRALTPWARQYKPELEQHLSALLGQTVRIDSMETSWYWFEPVVKLQDIRVSGTDGRIIKLDKLLLGVDLLQSLWHWHLQPGLLYIDGLTLDVKQTQGHWRINGLGQDGANTLSMKSIDSASVLAWVLAQQKILIKNVSGTISWQDGSHLSIEQLRLAVSRHAGRYRINAQASLDQTPKTSVQVMADMALDPYNWNEAQGDAYWSIQQASLAQWQHLFPATRYQMLDGQGDLQLWLGWQAGQLTSAQSQVDLRGVRWRDTNASQEQKMPVLQGNLAWTGDKDGWTFRADQLHLQLDEQVWPDNKLMVQYQTADKRYLIYAQDVLPQSLMALMPVWRDVVPADVSARLQAMQPHGHLRDTRLIWQQGQLQDVLGNFDKLGWKNDDSLPGVDNLTGVLHWSPQQGRLDLDSENVTLRMADKPPLTFTTINSSLHWTQASKGYRIQSDRLTIKHPDLLLTASLMVDEWTGDSAGDVDISAQLSASKVTQWLALIPSGHLKPKLDHWIKNDVKAFESLNMDVQVKGKATDFPFDKAPGEFWIKLYAQGVDLFFAPGWPMAQAIEGYARLDKRQFEASIVHARLLDNIVDNGSLRLTDLGLNHENLLLHTAVKVNAQKGLRYVLATPLSKKLSALAMLQIKGMVDLDLKIEAPLYPENDDVLALGDLSFQRNQLIVKHGAGHLALDDLSGSLQFDQQGVLDSNLNAMLMDYPVRLLIQSVRNASPYTEVKIKGKIAIDTLRSKLNWPVLSLIKGDFWLAASLVLTDEPNDLDHIRMSSSLKGVSIDLPKPLGKAASVAAPLQVDVEFNPRQAMRIRVDYDDRLNADLWYSAANALFQLQRGEIRLGPNQAVSQKQNGLQIVGELESFHLQDWLNTWSRIAAANNGKIMKNPVHFVGLMLRKATFGNRVYQNMAINASRSDQDIWTVEIIQALIKGKLSYNPANHELNGNFTRWHLEKPPTTAGSDTDNALLASLKPTDMPALNLSIDSLQYQDVDLGKAQIKTTPHPDSWRLDYCKISSPYYEFMAKGDWLRDDKRNQTKIEASLNINNLAKSLERWKISPVVEAKSGVIRFQGGWPGPLQQFSLTNVSGQVSIAFQNGRITNLSPETEEKLGLGKLLSILSLQTIPRRLQLDFSDLSHKGYSFDKFEGNFTLDKGLMSTPDSYIDGPIAYASMKGSLDIARQLYNLDLRISPHVTASLPIVATIAGGPIVGMATWVASKIINQGMQKISGYTYRITGPWKQPLVQQVSIIRKKKS